MSRWLLALVLALAASAIWVGAAFADASTYHSNYTNTTRACAGCHRAHTGVADNLLKATTTYGLCTSCHGTTNGLDVVDGAEWTTDANHVRVPGTPPTEALKGGGFVNALMNTSLAATGPAAPVPSTSAHKVNGMDGYTGDTVWGIGAINSGAGTSFNMECSTCHDPHGKSGTDAAGNPVATYRLLRSDMAEKVTGAAGPVTVPEDGYTSHFYGIDSATHVYYGQSYNAPIPPAGTTPYPDGTNVDLTKISQWCATCHTRVHATGIGAGSRDSGDSIYTFRHRTDGVAADNNFGTNVQDGGGTPACLTCHVSHGSSAAMTRQSLEIPKPGTAEKSDGGTSFLDSSLLRVNERGVCELCHNK